MLIESKKIIAVAVVSKKRAGSFKGTAVEKKATKAQEGKEGWKEKASKDK